MSKFGDIANAIAGGVGKSRAELALSMVQAAYPKGHPEVLFAQWMVDNEGRIREAITELGIEPPEPGRGLYQRLKDAVMPLLESQ